MACDIVCRDCKMRERPIIKPKSNANVIDVIKIAVTVGCIAVADVRAHESMNSSN